ncbi:hypothetical protein B0T25DRAFT_287460 [Lasiosphaeria hispida]|uniref:Uncharacterized protein n=1 Tax=Lasiosphaeria hispida TaxID=260671 RepID=A0AAJ0HCM3_9PEZI|nr:hypothetical protein B0T25DRAFT_287460 [Lasiosphaeria hispida]
MSRKADRKASGAVTLSHFGDCTSAQTHWFHPGKVPQSQQSLGYPVTQSKPALMTGPFPAPRYTLGGYVSSGLPRLCLRHWVARHNKSAGPLSNEHWLSALSPTTARTCLHPLLQPWTRHLIAPSSLSSPINHSTTCITFSINNNNIVPRS